MLECLRRRFCPLFKLIFHKHGINCESASDGKCKHVHPDDDGPLISHKIDEFINKRLRNHLWIPPDVPIACYKSICAFVTPPYATYITYEPGVWSNQVKKMSTLIAYYGQDDGCSKCGEVEIGWPKITDQYFVRGSLKFDWTTDEDIKEYCGIREGLCVGYWGSGLEGDSGHVKRSGDDGMGVISMALNGSGNKTLGDDEEQSDIVQRLGQLGISPEFKATMSEWEEIVQSLGY